MRAHATLSPHTPQQNISQQKSLQQGRHSPPFFLVPSTIMQEAPPKSSCTPTWGGDLEKKQNTEHFAIVHAHDLARNTKFSTVGVSDYPRLTAVTQCEHWSVCYQVTSTCTQIHRKPEVSGHSQLYCKPWVVTLYCWLVSRGKEALGHAGKPGACWEACSLADSSSVLLCAFFSITLTQSDPDSNWGPGVYRSKQTVTHLSENHRSLFLCGLIKP